MGERAVILAGGQGRRLAPYTAILPKPLMPVSEDESIIEHLLRGVASAGISEVTITLGHLGHLIEAVVGNGKRFGLRIDYTREDKPLGTAGPLALVRGVTAEDSILVINGDTFTNLDFREVLNRLNKSTEAVITCVERRLDSNYGVVHFDERGLMSAYDEKPSFGFVVSTGIYGLRGSALDCIQPNERLDMPDLLRTLRARGRSVVCFLAECEWKDLGRPADFEELHQQRSTESS